MNCFLIRCVVAPKRYSIIWKNESLATFGYRTFFPHFQDIDPKIFDDKKGISIDIDHQKIVDIKEIEKINITKELTDYLAKSEKSEHQLRQWLLKRLISKEKILDFVEKAKKERFIDQKRFAELFVQSKKLKATMPWWLTKKQLTYHGVESTIAEKFHYEDDQVLFGHYEQKYFKSLKEITKLQKQLLSKGFSFDKVKKLTDTISKRFG